MAASSAPRSKRRSRRFASKFFGLIAPAMVGGMLTAPARGESVVLTRTSPAFAGHEASIEVGDLAGLTFPALGATPATAATIHSAATALIPLADPPPPSRRRLPAVVPLEPADEADAARLAIPEPTALVLGLTSTLVLGSLSWKRRLTHHHPARAQPSGH